MEILKRTIVGISIFGILSCGGKDKSSTSPESPTKPGITQTLQELERKGYKTFDYIDEISGDTIIMQQYFMAFLKRGPNKSGSKEKADSLQGLHLSHLSRMYDLGYADISGPFGDDGEIRGITIYNTPNQKMADSLAHLDPLVQLGILEIEIHPWWAGKGFPLR